jgi:transketolase
MVSLIETRRDVVFITADLGYMALEGVAKAYGERFINAGIAEQNAVSLAAGLAREGHLPWFYSTSAFAVLRPYEQIRNDVCLHELPVKIVGNGGGYGFGIMGATHHSLEDVGAMRALPNMRVYLPLVAADVEEVVRQMAADPSPNYLRLNAPARLPLPGDLAPFAPWRKLKSGRGCVVVGMGPVVQGLYAVAPALLDELEIWSVGTLPLAELPTELLASIEEKGRLVTMEEHYLASGLGEALACALLSSGVAPKTFACLHASGYPSGRYGSQRWHLEENALAGEALVARLGEILRA